MRAVSSGELRDEKASNPTATPTPTTTSSGRSQVSLAPLPTVREDDVVTDGADTKTFDQDTASSDGGSTSQGQGTGVTTGFKGQ